MRRTKAKAATTMPPLRGLTVVVVTLLAVSGCATMTGSNRLLTGAGVGAAGGAVGGAVLSPNSESRGLNTLVFGLAGALVGGALAYLTDSKSPDPAKSGALEARERDDGISGAGRSFELNPPIKGDKDLPDFVRSRLKPLVIDEVMEREVIGEDGALHEPHKVYRIRRQPELVPQAARKQKP